MLNRLTRRPVVSRYIVCDASSHALAFPYFSKLVLRSQTLLTLVSSVCHFPSASSARDSGRKPPASASRFQCCRPWGLIHLSLIEL